jgi:hypothetical protein
MYKIAEVILTGHFIFFAFFLVFNGNSAFFDGEFRRLFGEIHFYCDRAQNLFRFPGWAFFTVYSVESLSFQDSCFRFLPGDIFPVSFMSSLAGTNFAAYFS